MKDKTSWFIRTEDASVPGVFGLGECGPLPGLSVDHRPDFEAILENIVSEINRSALSSDDEQSVLKMIPLEYPSILFGMETALKDLRNGGRHIIYRNSFCEGKPVHINGLIWMGDIDFMMDQINKKILQGFRCIKLKVGGLDFGRECDILSYIRRRYFKDDIIIRLDANGAFKTDEVLFKLEEMSKFGIHSIEQPLRAGLEEMGELCRKSPIPIALDEELIGVYTKESKIALLERLKPQFIVLKPTLHGGLSGCDEWISIAGSMGIGWWITSALESNIGLNAIYQFTANYDNDLPQGLGTGSIYDTNIPPPLVVKDGHIYWDQQRSWEVE
jgi:o-succinylbenzoate synthase